MNEIISAGTVFHYFNDWPPGRDTVGFAPRSYALEEDEEGPYARVFCRIDAYRALPDPYLERTRIWARMSRAEQDWHLAHYTGENAEPVYRPTFVSAGLPTSDKSRQTFRRLMGL